MHHDCSSDGCIRSFWWPAAACAHLSVNSLLSACWWVIHRAAQELLVSSNAVRYGSRLRAIASWVRVLAFGAVARRESYSIGSGELPTENGRSKQVNLLIVPVKDNEVAVTLVQKCSAEQMTEQRMTDMTAKLREAVVWAELNMPAVQKCIA